MMYLRKFRSHKGKNKKTRKWSYKYGYYNYVRLTVSAVAIYGLYIVGNTDSNLWRYIFAVLLVLYNNIRPIQLKPKTWNVLHVMVLGIIISTFFLI